MTYISSPNLALPYYTLHDHTFAYPTLPTLPYLTIIYCALSSQTLPEESKSYDTIPLDKIHTKLNQTIPCNEIS